MLPTWVSVPPTLVATLNGQVTGTLLALQSATALLALAAVDGLAVRMSANLPRAPRHV